MFKRMSTVLDGITASYDATEWLNCIHNVINYNSSHVDTLFIII